TLQQRDRRVDLPAALRGQPFRSRFRELVDFDPHLVQRGAGDQRIDETWRDAQVDHRSVAHVGPTARQAVGEVTVRLEAFAPRLAPERGGDLPPVDGD